MAISQQILTILKGMTICMKRKFDTKTINYLEGGHNWHEKEMDPKKVAILKRYNWHEKKI
jgi:hypothetical protein